MAAKEGARPLAEVRHASGMVWKRLRGGKKVEGTKEKKRGAEREKWGGGGRERKRERNTRMLRECYAID